MPSDLQNHFNTIRTLLAAGLSTAINSPRPHPPPAPPTGASGWVVVSRTIYPLGAPRYPRGYTGVPPTSVGPTSDQPRSNYGETSEKPPR